MHYYSVKAYKIEGAQSHKIYSKLITTSSEAIIYNWNLIFPWAFFICRAYSTRHLFWFRCYRYTVPTALCYSLEYGITDMPCQQYYALVLDLVCQYSICCGWQNLRSNLCLAICFLNLCFYGGELFSVKMQSY